MIKKSVACVLRSGGEYGPEHVMWLRDQVAEHLPGVEFLCFSDVEVSCGRVRLAHSWPGWWSKLEVFATHVLPGDVLYLDLDTVLVSECSLLMRPLATFALSDVNGGDTLQSSIMYLTEADRDKVWHEWIREPEAHMKRCGGAGDQKFIGEVLPTWGSWQKALPGAFLSYKVDVLRNHMTTPPEGARVICFHGKPRPWQVEASWIPKLP